MRLGFVGAGLRRLAGGLTGEINIGLGMGMGSSSGGDGLGRAGPNGRDRGWGAMFGMAGRTGLRRRRIAFAIPRAAAKGA